MIDIQKKRFLFVCLLILGKDTAYKNLRSSISMMKDIDSTWLPIEMDPKELFTRIPPISMNHSLKFGLVAKSRVRSMEKLGKTFDAAFFNHILVTPLLKNFRKRVPSLDAMDITPALLLRDGKPYYEKPRNDRFKSLLNIKRKLAQSVLESAAYLLPQSNYVRESLLFDYNISDEKIKVIAPGVDVQFWPGRLPINSYNEKRSPFNILFVGGDFWRKGGDLLLGVASREEFSNCQFHFVTRRFEGNILPNVFIHSHVTANSDTLLNLYQSADVFVLPTRADFAPTNSICEAMAMGLPVISTAVGGIDENVIDGENGFIVPVNDEETLSRRLTTLKNNIGLRLRFGRNARKFAQSNLNLAVNSRIIVDLMKKASDGKKSDSF